MEVTVTLLVLFVGLPILVGHVIHAGMRGEPSEDEPPVRRHAQEYISRISTTY